MFIAGRALPLIGQETFPAADERGFFLSVQMPRGTALDVPDRAARPLVQLLIEETLCTGDVMTSVASTFAAAGTHLISFRVTLKPEAPSTQQAINDMRPRV